MGKFNTNFIYGLLWCAAFIMGAKPAHAQKITILSQPKNCITTPGKAATFNVVAQNAIRYQWEVNSGKGFSSIPEEDGNGAASATLKIMRPNRELQGYRYRCVLFASNGTSVTSRIAILRIKTAPSAKLDINPYILRQPRDGAACPGTAHSFSVSAIGQSLTYQWFVDTGFGYNMLHDDYTYGGAKKAKLTIANISPKMDGYSYKCVVYGVAPLSVTSSPAKLTVNETPGIIRQPVNATTCNGKSTSFMVMGSGKALTYQWMADTGSGFVAIADNGTYDGVATRKLTINARSYMNNYVYKCVVTGLCAPATISDSALLTVYELPRIAAQPTDTATCPGAYTQFSITATGSGLNFRWQVDTGAGYHNINNNGYYSGVTTPQLAVKGANKFNGYHYRCMVSGFCTPAVTSAAAMLTINKVPAVTASPVKSTICEGGSTTFTVAGAGTMPAYQWMVNTGTGFVNTIDTGIYNGSNTTTLHIATATPGMSGYIFKCMVSGACPSAVSSKTALLTVNSHPAINQQPTDTTLCSGNTAIFAVAATGTALKYQWQADTGTGYYNLANNSYYTGVKSATLSVKAIPKMSGYHYINVVSGICPPAVISRVAQITVNKAPAITAQPKNTVVCQHDAVSFTVTASGSALTYQWQVDSGSGFGNITDTTAYQGISTHELTIADPLAGMSGNKYQCIINGICSPAVTSRAAALVVHSAPVITRQPSSKTVCEGDSAIFIVTATGSSLSYQWQQNSGSGFVDVAANGAYDGTTTRRLAVKTTPEMSGTQFRCIINGICPPMLFTSTVTLMVHTAPKIVSQPADTIVCEGHKAVFAIKATGTTLTYLWQQDTGSGFYDITDTASYTGINTARIIAVAGRDMAGYRYRCIIKGVCPPADTSDVATLGINLLPAITTQPVKAVTCENNDTSFLVEATGTGLSYQWLVDTGNGFSYVVNTGEYSGTNTPKMMIIHAIPAMNGYLYKCRVSGVCTPVVTSRAVALTVYSLPRILTQSKGDTVCDGDTATFSITAAGTNIQYQWQVNKGTSFANLAENATYQGVRTASLNISGATTGMSKYTYRCIVKGPCGADTTMEYPLTVYKHVAITTQPQDVTVCAGIKAYFTVAGSGTNIGYQWQIDSGRGYTNVANSTTYTGATTVRLGVTSKAGMDGYRYRCVISGYCIPYLNSDGATLSVQTPPAIVTQPVALTVPANNKAQFTILATGSNLTYQWQADTLVNYYDLADATPYNGVTTSSLAIDSTLEKMKGYLFRCTVSGSCPSPVTSRAVKLLVTAAPPPPVTDGAGITLYPNPVTGAQMSVQFSNITQKHVTVEILTTAGKPAHSSSVNFNTAGGNLAHIDISTLARGSYILKVLNRYNGRLLYSTHFIRN